MTGRAAVAALPVGGLFMLQNGAGYRHLMQVTETNGTGDFKSTSAPFGSGLSLTEDEFDALPVIDLGEADE